MSRAFDITMRVFAGLGIISFSLLILLVVMEMWKMPVHQFHLWKLGRNLQEIDAYHPLDSELLANISRLKDFPSNSSRSCNYLVGEIRSTKYAPEDVRLQYSGVFVHASAGMERLPVDVHFFGEEEFFMAYPWNEWRTKLRQSLGMFAALSNVYAVFVSQPIRPPYGDFRCH